MEVALNKNCVLCCLCGQCCACCNRVEVVQKYHIAVSYLSRDPGLVRRVLTSSAPLALSKPSGNLLDVLVLHNLPAHQLLRANSAD